MEPSDSNHEHNDSDELVLVNAFECPRLCYDTVRKTFHAEKEKWPFLGTVDDKVSSIASVVHKADRKDLNPLLLKYQLPDEHDGSKIFFSTTASAPSRPLSKEKQVLFAFRHAIKLQFNTAMLLDTNRKFIGKTYRCTCTSPWNSDSN